ncbi:MAG: hypothetical protein QOF53_3149 [Nocardioidaceae bacterium]|nr:hypothetical protein [Nocardioidaceae bacterium]
MTPINTRPRYAIAAAAVLLASMAFSTMPLLAQAAGPVSRPGLGFRIGRTPHADGRWVGRYRIGGQRDYRIQPRKGNVESAYHAPHRFPRVHGASLAATRRSAWVLSTYGGTSDRTTAAAVDVAVNALLSRGRWRVGTAYTAHRTNSTGVGRFIRAYAKIMVRQSKHRHGPYRTTFTAHRVPAGDQTTLTVRVQNKQGRGPVITGQQRGLAVDVTYPGEGRRTVYLNNHGVGRVYFRAAAGRTPIIAAVHRVPDAALFLRRPKNRAASRVAVAGHHRTLRLRGYGLGVSTQALRITNTSASVLVGHPLQASYGVTGLTGGEIVDYAVYGPFTAATSSCAGTPLITATATISSNGTRSLPQWKPARTGYYAWRIAARGNSTTRPATACGTAYLTQKHTTVEESRVGAVHAVTIGHAFHVKVIVSGFDRPEVHTVYTRVYGPFVHQHRTRCTRSRLFRTLPTSLRNNQRRTMTTVVNRERNAGYYVFRTTMNAGTFMLGARSRCGNLIHVTR